MRSLSVRTESKQAHIIAHAVIRDKRPNAAYVWSVRILDLKLNVILEKRYDHLCMTVPAEHEMNPDFEDIVTLPVPAGTYLLEVLAYLVPPGLGVDGLDDKRIAFDNRGPVGTVKIIITE